MNKSSILSCTGSIWAVKFYWLDTFLLYTVTDQDIPVRNGNSISADFTEDTIKNWWHCRINTIDVHSLKISNSFALAVKQNRKVRQRPYFLPVSKACTNKLFIFWQCTYIGYLTAEKKKQNWGDLLTHLNRYLYKIT